MVPCLCVVQTPFVAEVDKIRNAYLLLYERVAHVPEFDITETKDDAEDKKDEEDKAAGTSDTEDAASAAEDAPVAAAVGQEDVKVNAADDEDDSDDGSYVLLREQAPKQTENLDRDILKVSNGAHLRLRVLDS